MSIATVNTGKPAVNTCRLCAPLGACLAFKGIEDTITILHGSQGCATYIRRYLISHFREPMDIASSSFTEETAIFGGKENLLSAVDAIIRQYNPQLLGVATTCLSETIGEDLMMHVKDINEATKGSIIVVPVSTPSYAISWSDGYRIAVKNSIMVLASDGKPTGKLNVIPGLLSPEDLRYIKEIVDLFQIESVIMPDYSTTLDGETWTDYQKIPKGGTKIADIRAMGRSSATIEFGSVGDASGSAGTFLNGCFNIPDYLLHIPIGIGLTDNFMSVLSKVSGRPTPEKLLSERGRLMDSYVDGHKYVFEKRVVLYGEDDLVVALCKFCSEIGMIPVVCASGSDDQRLLNSLKKTVPEIASTVKIITSADFDSIANEASKANADLFIGSSKGYPAAKQLNLPLVRAGFPVHDRFGGQRIMHIGYKGTQMLFDRIVNALLERKQETGGLGYAYL